MRKEDLKKLYREEKIVLAAEQILFKSVLFTFLCLSNLPAQIPINGFYRYREFSAKANYTNIFPVDYNSDGYRDLLISNPVINKYSTLTSDQKSNFGNSSEKYFSSSITDIHPFGNEISGKKFLIALGKSRQIVLAAFSRRGVISVNGKIKFDGVPSHVDVGDINGDGKPEGLVSGNTLYGLHILKEKNRTVKESKFETRKVFSWSSFIDLDYDSYADIAAIDPISNSIIFYTNNHSGDFRESRSIGLDGNISQCKTADFNSDGFTDIVLVKNNHFEVMLGDSVSSFQKKIILDTPVNPDQFTLLDFNGDGFNDAAFINRNSGELYISFGKSTNLFYPPILYMKKNGLVDITSYVDRAGKKLAILGADGKVYLINTIGINDASFSISVGNKPSGFLTFDYMNDKFKDICFLDESGQSLKLLLSERRNLFRTYFSIPLTDKHSNIQVDDTAPKTKTFYLYSKGKQIIEIVRMNFENHNYSRLIVYADKPIEDLKISSDRMKDWQTIFVLGKKDGTLFMQNIEVRGFRKASSETFPITSGAENGWLTFEIYRDVYSFSRVGSKLELTKFVFNKKIIEKKTLLTFEFDPKENLSYNLLCVDEKVYRSRPVAALITVNKNSTLYYFTDKALNKFSLKYSASSTAMLGYSIDESGDEPTFYYNDDKRNKIRSVKINTLSGEAIDNELIESKNINNYLVTGLNKGRTFLIYSNLSQNTISFEKLL